MENLTGKQLGPYRIVEPLGEGGMAAVYKAFQPGVERHVALKILPSHLAKNPEFVTRFKREAGMLAQLQHPHLLPVFDYGESDGYTYIVMPLLKSGTLDEMLTGKPLPDTQIEHIMSQLGSALDYAHSKGIIHRDIKPSNVLIDEQGNCLLTDFGIAKMVEGQDKLTSTGTIVGTPAYMSPEHGAGKSLDKRSDIYSLGVILFELVTGRVPFRAETPVAVVVKHMHDPLPMPRTLNSGLSDAVEAVVLKALAKNPADRYATTGDMAKALGQAFQIGPTKDGTLADVVEPTRRSSKADIQAASAAGIESAPTEALSHRKKSGSWIGVGVGAILLLMLVGGGFFFWQGRQNLPTYPTVSATAVVAVALPTDTPTLQATDTPLPTNTPVPTNTAVPTNTPASTNTPVPTNTPIPSVTPTSTPVIDTEFPMPSGEIRQFTKAANNEQILFITDWTTEELLNFYRKELTEQGLVEREITTTVGDWGFSLVFDGSTNGQALVVQVTDLGQSTADDSRSVAVRYEDI